MLLLIAILSVLVLSGPRVKLDDSVSPVTLPQDLDQYLRDREARFTDIRPGTHKTILWAEPQTRAKTPLALIYLHGFAASRQEISPVTETIAKSLGANLFQTRLSGHGRSATAMANVSVNTLVNDAVEALEIAKAIGNKVIVVATSTGATLAGWLAAHDRDKAIAALILISPNFGLKRSESELMLLPWGRLILKLVQGDQYSFAPLNKLQERYWTTSFPSQALLPMMGLVKITREKYLKQIRQPVLVIYSPKDTVVSIAAIEQHYNQLAAAPKKLLAIPSSGDPQNHVLTGDIMSPQTTGRVIGEITRFVRQLSLDAPPSTNALPSKQKAPSPAL